MMKNSYQKKLMLLVYCLFISIGTYAQVTVRGKVVDGAGLELIGANIHIKGSQKGTLTDMDGNYSIADVRSNDILIFTYIGYMPKEVKVGNQTVLNVTMEEGNAQLEEVVIVAYGTAKKKDLTGALTTIDPGVISVQSTSSITKALEGTVPGLQVAAADGQPGVDMGIRIRGVGSTNTNSSGALVVIDGVPAQNDNPLSNINSQDIANITILKDAASTALYGSRGANGVVLITTKKGASGKTKVSFSGRWGVNSAGPFKVGKIDNAADYYQYAWKSIYNSYRYGMNGTGGPQNFKTNVGSPNYTHDQAAQFASQHLFNYTNSETTFGRNQLGNFVAYKVPGAVFTPDGTASSSSGTMSGAYLVNPDGRLNPSAQLLYNDTYDSELLSDKFRQEYNVSASGGTDKIDFFVSLGYLGDPSYISNSNFDRYSGRANLNAKLYDWLKVGANVGYSRTQTNAMATAWGRNPGANQGNVFRFINGTAPIVPVYRMNEDGTYVTNPDGTRAPYYNYTEGATYHPFGPKAVTQNNYGGTNILYTMENDIRRERMDNLTSRVYAEVSFLKDFKALVNLSLDKNNFLQTRYMNSLTGIAKGKGGMFQQMYDQTVLNTQEMLTYNKDINKHHIDVMAAHEFNSYSRDQLTWGSGYELIPGFLSSANFVGKYVNGASSMGGPGSSKEITRMESYLGRANYVYDDKYYASASIRGDGSSKFKKERWGTFWSVGAGWRISAENFMEGTKGWLDNAKIRASYGVIGNANAIGNYSGYRTWGYGANYTETSAGTGTPNGVYKLSPGGFVNDALTWENTKTFDVGLDFTLFNNRLYGTFDFYNRVTSNSFYNQPVSYLATGQSTLQSNSAEITNQGIEIELGSEIIRTKNFSWNLSVNGTHYTTKLTGVPPGSIPKKTEGIPDNTYMANGEGWSASGTGNVAGVYYLRGVDRDWYNLYIYKYAGVEQSSGLPQYWHKVSEKDVETKKYPDAKVGEDIKVTNYNEASRYEMGSAIPAFIGGLNTTFTYKDFDLSAVLAFQLGGKFFSTEYGNGMYKSSTSLNATAGVLSKDLIGNTWTPENPNAKYPMQWYGVDNYDGTTFGSWLYTDMALFDASYMRVKNITLGYTLPSNLLKKVKISKLRVYASADNPFMISAAKGVDPSMSLTGGLEVGAFTYPTMRTLSLGINLDF